MGLVTSGSLVIGVLYLLNMPFAVQSGFSNQTGWLAVPVGGPFLTAGMRDWDADQCDPEVEEYCDDFSLDPDHNLDKAFLVLNGLGQTVGAVLIIAGFASTRRRLVRNDVAQVFVAPVQVGSGYGVGALGRF